MASKSSASKDYMAGIAAGVATVAVGHPFDTIKVKLQTQKRSAHVSQYRNAFHCLFQVLAADGVKGLYRGATPSFLGMSLESSLLFGVYTQLRTSFQAGDESSPLLSTILPAAFLAGASVSTVLCPTELVKCRLQVQPKSRAGVLTFQIYDGPVDCAIKTLQREGGLPSYRLKVKEHSQPDVSGGSTKNYSNHLMEAGVGVASGGVAGIAFWLTVLPLDVAKTRIQTSQEKGQSRNPFVHLRLIHRELGIRGLYAGLGPTLIRAFPANAASVVTWEVVSKFLAGRL